MTIPDSPAPGTARGVAAIPSIAVVDDEAATREMVGDYLKLHGFAVVLCDGGRALREHLAHHSPDLIVLDLNMPEEDGLSIVRDLKARTAIPIIMLTATASAIDRVVGLELGADDYLPKPCELRELVARVRSVLRRVQMPERRAGPGSRGRTPDPVRHQVAGTRRAAPERRCRSGAGAHPLGIRSAEGLRRQPAARALARAPARPRRRPRPGRVRPAPSTCGSTASARRSSRIPAIRATSGPCGVSDTYSRPRGRLMFPAQCCVVT